MPVKWILHWHPNAGATVNTQIMNEICQCAESLNGVKEGRWKSVLTFYKPITRDQSMAAEFPRDFLGLSVPEQPNKYYFIIRGQRIVLEADATIQTIMENLQSYKSRVSLNFEGTQYQLGDFQVRVGKVAPSHSETMRGIVMEVEYLPISSIDKSRQILEDFVDIWKDTLSKRFTWPISAHGTKFFRLWFLRPLYVSTYRGSVCYCDGAIDRNCTINTSQNLEYKASMIL